jgi:hypothetical protein
MLESFRRVVFIGSVLSPSMVLGRVRTIGFSGPGRVGPRRPR